MSGAILFACGGAANHVLGSGIANLGIQVEFLDVGESDSISIVKDGGSGHDSRREVKDLMVGKRIVFGFAMIGGATATNALMMLSQCSHEAGCEFVTVIGIPFEDGRREAAMATISDIVAVSDRSFILDSVALTRLYPDMVMHRALNMMATSIQFAVKALISLVDGPFFSTFTRKVYTIAYTSALYPSDAVARAAEASFFDVDPSYGKSVVMVSSGFGSAQIESIFGTVASMTGIIPDIMKRDDFEDTKVLTFIPIQTL